MSCVDCPESLPVLHANRDPVRLHSCRGGVFAVRVTYFEVICVQSCAHFLARIALLHALVTTIMRRVHSGETQRDVDYHCVYRPLFSANQREAPCWDAWNPVLVDRAHFLNQTQQITTFVRQHKRDILSLSDGRASALSDQPSVIQPALLTPPFANHY